MKSLFVKININVVLGIIGIGFLFFSQSCKEKPHHLIEDVTREVRHDDDTIGWNGLLRQLNGVWVHQKYLKNLDRTRSIYETNRNIPTKFTVLNIDSRQFISDSLRFLAITSRDVKNWKSCIYFGKRNGRAIMEVTTQHPVFKGSNSVMTFSLDSMEFETFLILEQSFSDVSFGGVNASDKDRYVKISDDVSFKEYEYYPLIGIEIYMRKYLKGTYNVYDANNQIVHRHIQLNEDGTISHHSFAKYRLTPWVGFDALLIQGMALVEEQPRPNQKYYGLKMVNNNLELYQIIKNRKDEVIMGNLEFTLKR